MSGDGLLGASDAFAAAAAEARAATQAEAPAAEPAAGAQAAAADEQASAPAAEQPVDTAGTAQPEPNPLAAVAEAEGRSTAPTEEQIMGALVTVETSAGPKSMTVAEAVQGVMRQQDYTQKTQEVARERKLLGEAADFYNEFRNDPQGFAQTIAAKAGLIAEDGVTVKEGVKLWTADDVQAEVERQLQEQLAGHPDVVAARDAQAEANIALQFDALEVAERITLTPEDRMTVLQEAQRTQNPNLQQVYESLVYRGQKILAEQAAKAGSSGLRPARAPDPTEQPIPDAPPKTVLEAASRAKEQIAARAT